MPRSKLEDKHSKLQCKRSSILAVIWLLFSEFHSSSGSRFVRCGGGFLPETQYTSLNVMTSPEFQSNVSLSSPLLPDRKLSYRSRESHGILEPRPCSNTFRTFESAHRVGAKTLRALLVVVTDFLHIPVTPEFIYLMQLRVVVLLRVRGGWGGTRESGHGSTQEFSNILSGHDHAAKYSRIASCDSEVSG